MPSDRHTQSEPETAGPPHPVSRSDTSGVDGSAFRTADIHVVANRLPVTWDGSGWRRAPGGLVTALSSLMVQQRLDWVGSAASLGTFAGEPPRWQHGTLGMLDVPQPLAEEAIGGMANQTLWPALHGEGRRVRWQEQWWEAYVGFNRRFCDYVAGRAHPRSLVWVHDYHLLLLPAMLALARPDVAVGLSLHTPIDVEGLGDVPVVESLIRGLRAARVIGVQTARDASALHELVGAVPPDEANPPTVVVSPVSVDPAALDSVRRQPVVAALADRERRRTGGRTLIVGVDRLDYTKGVLERLEAYRLAFDRGWMAADGVRIVQVAQPTRPGVAEYRSLQLEVERAVHQMKADFQRPDGTSAIEAQIESVGHREVVALLASADIAMVTPRRDGMNLVAKEFSVVNSRDGVLVLSRGAGAADELGPASVVVDGAEPASVAAGLRTALALPAARRREMAVRRGSVVHGWTSEHWCRDFLSRLRSESDSSAPATR